MKNQFMSVIIEWESEDFEVILYKKINYENYKDFNNVPYKLKDLGFEHRDNKPVSKDLLYSELDRKFWSLDAAKAWCEERTIEMILVKVESIDEIKGEIVSDKFQTVKCKTNILIPGTDVKREFDLLTPKRVQHRPLDYGSVYHYFGGGIAEEKIRFHIAKNGMFTTEYTNPDGVVSKEPYLDPEIKSLLTKGLMGLGVIYLLSLIF